MKIHITILAIFISFYSGRISGQILKKADKLYHNYSYAEAIQMYNKLLEKGKSNPQVIEKLGNAYYFTANYEKAANTYQKLVEDEQANISKEVYYRYVQSLRSLKQYEQADQEMDKLINDFSVQDNRAKLFLKNRDYLKRIRSRVGFFKVEEADFNSGRSDFAPSFYNKQLVFTSARDTGLLVERVHKWNNEYFLDLYQVEIDGKSRKVKKFPAGVNTKHHESSSVFASDGLTMFFTKNNTADEKTISDERGVTRLKIYRTDFVNGEWEVAKELPFCADSYSTAHPALSPDNQTLYFASDREGGFGGSDLYAVAIKEDGTYGEPKNLGASINTEGKESFPFISNNNILYFASDGHPGLGGLDVFAIPLEAENVTAFNLGTDINSTADDFSYIINDSLLQGYFASNRSGIDNIYKVFQEKENLLEAIQANYTRVTDSISAKELELDSTVALQEKQWYNQDGEKLQQSEIKEMLTTNTPIAYDKDGKPVSLKDWMKKRNKNFVPEEEGSKEVAKNAVGEDIAPAISKDRIFFEYDQWVLSEASKNILQELANYLQKHPNLHIDIRSYTDSRATEVYNLRLSNKRAKATAEYLWGLGIQKKRVKYRGYGESDLVNRCDSAADCSEQEHAQNRRSEFIIIKN